MAKCVWCSKKFDPETAEEEFAFEYEADFFSYDNIKPCLCGQCAIQAVEDKEAEVYYSTCSKCGKTFDVFEDERAFSNYFPGGCLDDSRDTWDKLSYCADCAIEKAESDPTNYSSDYDEDNDIKDEGCIGCGNLAYPDCKTGCSGFDD